MYNRSNDRRRGHTVFYPIRYADDFVILVTGTQQDALREKEALADYLRESLKLQLSEEKTLVTPLTRGFEFLGHRVRLRWDKRYGYRPRVEVPKEKIKDLKYRLKQKTKRNRLYLSLRTLLKELNPILRGWGYFYRHCHNGKRIFSTLDAYLWRRLYGWLCKKYRRLPVKKLVAKFFKRPPSGRRKRWTEGIPLFLMSEISVFRYNLRWMGYPDFAYAAGEPDA